ncbi:hypothetical protein MMC11_005368 [Xylographa trunciseda]|nr:hypothetical protein [Xylographa trunciseda]
MDLLSVTSSIAGILSIAGQSIDGIVKLKQLFSDISAASKTIGTFLRDINSLLHVLHDVEALLFQLDIRTYSGAIDISTASLQIELEDCLKDVFAWLRTARSLRPPSDLGTRAWLQKVWVAINQNSVKGIREDIGRHKQALQVNLALIGSRCDQSLWQGPSLTEIRRNNPDVDKIKKSRSKGSPCGTENSGIWISGSWNARDDAHEHPSRSSRSHYFEDDYKALDNTTAQFFPKSVARYISHRQMVVMLTSQIRLLPVHSDLNPQHKSSELAMEFQQTLKARLAILMDEMKVLRNTCLQASYALYEIDQVLAVAQEEDIGASQNSHRAAHQDMLELRRSTLESNLLQTWTNSRDRINGWLLHSLRADDKLAQLHRAILGEQDIGEKAWARLVLKYWTLDEAATGKPLSRAQSAAATNSVHSVSTQSLDFWTCNESAGDHDELLTGVRLGQVRTELEALKRQHHRRLYKAFVNSASSEADESDNGVGLEMR